MATILYRVEMLDDKKPLSKNKPSRWPGICCCSLQTCSLPRRCCCSYLRAPAAQPACCTDALAAPAADPSRPRSDSPLPACLPVAAVPLSPRGLAPTHRRPLALHAVVVVPPLKGGLRGTMGPVDVGGLSPNASLLNLPLTSI